ncbi:MAG: HD-GYP domain-containing protein [Coriobacteriia bacterium]
MSIKNTLLARFSLIGLAVTIAAAALLGYLLQRDLTGHELEQAGALAVMQVSAGVSPHLTVADMSTPLTATRVAELDTLANRDLMEYGTIVLVKIWNRDGTVVYSNDKSLIGKRFPHSEQLRAALKGMTTTEISDEALSGNAAPDGSHERLLETFAPLRLRNDDQIVGAYELYADVAPLDHRVEHTRRIIAGGVLGGFGILYLALFGVVYGASNRLISQASENARLAEEIIFAYDETIAGWSRALDLRDEETEGHSARVTEMTVAVATAMGFPADELSDVRRGALLHDIGKMGVPDAILLKPGPLDDVEWEIMRKHPGYAKRMLEGIGYLRRALEIPYAHHERWDGTGYPQGLRGEAIPLPARIFALADVWDALSNDRPYRNAWPVERIREMFLEESGKHFDPAVVQVFLSVIDVPTIASVLIEET